MIFFNPIFPSSNIEPKSVNNTWRVNIYEDTVSCLVSLLNASFSHVFRSTNNEVHVLTK